ncbi:MAG: phytanoyl-CoA dioxygenase family protein [Pseudomonadota bacterium]
MGYRLNAAERVVYAEEGLVKPDYRLGAGELSELRDLTELTLDATPGQRPESILCPHIEGMNGLPAEITARWLQFCATSDLLDLVEDIIGPDIILWGSQLFCKPAGTGLEVPWHQDGAFWPIRPLAACSIWVAIDDVTLENGAMRYIKGSHKDGAVLQHDQSDRTDLALNQVLPESALDLDRVATDDLPAGAISLHDVYLVHGSAPNTSPNRRAGFVVRYMPSTSHYDRSLAKPGSSLINTRLGDRPIYLLRGSDHTGKTGLVDLRVAA